MKLCELKEGMGGSSGGGTPGAGGAGGSSLGLPYPSTYEDSSSYTHAIHVGTAAVLPGRQLAANIFTSSSLRRR